MVLLSHIGVNGVVMVNAAFEWSSAARRPEVNRQAIAGIWKLTPTLPHPLKEFTVYPKKPRIVPPELLLLLKEDGSFQQYESMTPKLVATERNDDDTTGTRSSQSTDIDASWRQFQRNSVDNNVSQEQQQRQQNKLFPWVGYIQKGKWDYLDGNLLLAADRIDGTNTEMTAKGTSYSALADGTTTTTTAATRYDATSSSNSDPGGTGTGIIQSVPGRSKDDTLLKGRVIANYQTRLDDNPILLSSVTTQSNATTASHPNTRSPTGSSSKTIKFDTYLSVPRGSIQIGKFMYPKHHPSFFEQPMFQPMKMGNFALRQILGSLNAANPSAEDDDDNAMMEQFQRSDLYNRTFLLTSSPLRQLSSDNDNNNNNRGEKRWSIKYNKYVYDAPSSKKKKSIPTPDNTPTSAVRVLQIVFHRNNTFSTTGGLGNAAILRGKFDIIGNDKDHLWMQVLRFGFGRSVSGSVYSEGPMLSHEDIKAYWGKIRKVITNTTHIRDGTEINNNEWTRGNHADHDNNDENVDDPSHYRIEVEGSVLDGLGLEPMPVARFQLREIDPISMSDNNDEDDEDEEDEIDVLEATTVDSRLDDDGVDWTSMDDSFQ